MLDAAAAVKPLRDQDDPDGSTPATGALTDEESSAAGWLSEALTPSASPIAATSEAIAGPSQKGVANMGDAILRGLTSVSSDFMKTAAKLHESMESNGGGAPSIMGALRMHMEFTLVSTQAEVISKCVSKSEQTIEQLVKQQ
nr:EscI/YscI/HrpB family type III secretion system inner rod protein [uncultured Noviherbaspirillum sp.]